MWEVSSAAQCSVAASSVAACYCATQTGRWLRGSKLLRLLGRLFTRQTPAEALRFACAAGALTAAKAGAQSSLPWRGEVEAALGGG